VSITAASKGNVSGSIVACLGARRAVLAGDHAEAVVLDLVQPLAARRQSIGFGRKARRDEPGREGTL